MGSTEATNTAATTPAREEWMFALHYGRRYGVRLGRALARFAGLLRFAELILGSGAAAAFFAGSPVMAAWCGLVMAGVSAINIAFDPATKAHEVLRGAESFGTAIARADDMNDAELKRTVSELQAIPRPSIDALREPVWRDVMMELHGHREHTSMRTSERLADAFI